MPSFSGIIFANIWSIVMVGAALNEKFKILYRFLKILNRAQQCSSCLELDIENDFQFLNFLHHIIQKVLVSQKWEKKTKNGAFHCSQCFAENLLECWYSIEIFRLGPMNITFSEV